MPATSLNRRTADGLAWSGLSSIAPCERVRGGVKVGARVGSCCGQALESKNGPVGLMVVSGRRERAEESVEPL